MDHESNSLHRLSEEYSSRRQGVWIFEAESGREQWSDGLFFLAGFSAEEHPSPRLVETFPPLNEFLLKLERERRQTATFDFSLFDERLGLRRFFFHVDIQRDTTGKAIVYQGVLTDLTDPDSESVVRNFDQPLLTAVRNSPDSIIAVTEPGGIITLIDGKGLEKIGVRPEDLIGRSVYEVFSDSEAIRQVEDGLKGRISHGIIKFRERFFLTRTLPLFDAERNVHGTIGFAVDITESHLAEQNARNVVEERLGRLAGELRSVNRTVAEQSEIIRSNEEMLRAIFDANNVPIVFFTLVDRKITYCNAAFEEFIGYSQEELIGMDTRDLLVPDDPISNRYFEIREAIVSRKKDCLRADLKHLRKDGSVVWSNTCLTFFHAADPADSMGTAIIFESTERHRLMEELQTAKEDAETGNMVKDQFISTMNHEIRTPLNGILGLADLLLESDLPPKPLEYAKLIRVSGKSLLYIMNDILDFSGLLSKKIVLEEEPFDLHTVIESVFETSATAAHQKGIEIGVTFGSKIPKTLIGDSMRLRQLLNPLLDNGIKYTETGGVRMDIAFEKIDGKNLFLRFTVMDTGIGLTPGAMEMLFEPFFQVDSSYSRQYSGTGLGLAVVKKIVELFGGSISVRSEGLGRGSEFTLILPFRFRPETLNIAEGLRRLGKSPAELNEEFPFKDLEILLVDDNEVQRRLLREQIEQWGGRLTVCASKRDAFEILQKAAGQGRPFRLAVIDSTLEDAEGSDLVEAIESEPGLDLGMILLVPATGNIAEEIKHLGSLVAVDVFCVPKPVYGPAFFEAVCSALRYGQSSLTKNELTANRYRVLIVEDNRINQIVIAEILEAAGYEIALAKNGVEACEQFDENSFDVILMDCQMPVMDGFEATQWIRWREQQRFSPPTPIIALTANTSLEDEKHCFAVGMDSFCGKPVDAKQLLDYIRRWTA